MIKETLFYLILSMCMGALALFIVPDVPGNLLANEDFIRVKSAN